MKSKNNTVSITGFGPLIIRLAGIFSNELIRFIFTLPGFSPAKAERIMSSKGIICKGSVCYLVLVISDVILAVALQVLNKPINRCLAIILIPSR